MFRKALHELNLQARARELGVPVWITPQFIFLVMGGIVIAVLLVTRVIALQYLDPDLSFLIILGLSIFLLVITYVVVNAFEKILEAKQSEAAQAREVLALKDQFVFIAAHELRTPVNAIKWAVELMESKQKGASPQGGDILQVLGRSADRLLHLVTDLLEVARLESKAIHFSYGGFAPRKICEEISTSFMGQAGEERKGVSCDIPFDAPDILADENRFKEIIDNLLSNALKFSPVGSHVKVGAKWDESNVIVFVADQGPGISPDDASRVFKKFWRSDNIKKTEGTGLGLFIAKHLAEQMNGQIWFESPNNANTSQDGEQKGTTFFIKLPRAN